MMDSTSPSPHRTDLDKRIENDTQFVFSETDVRQKDAYLLSIQLAVGRL